MVNKTLMVYTDHKIDGSSDDYGGVGYYRVVQPAKSIGAEYTGNFVRLITGADRSEDIEDMYHKLWQKYDVIYIKYLNEIKHATYLLAGRDFYHKKLVVDFDDDVFNIDHSTFTWQFYKDRQHCFKIWEMLATHADAVTVYTERLKGIMTKYNKNTYVIPNAFDFSIYENKPKNNKKIRIMWAGSISHEPDLAMVAPALREVQRKYGNKIEIFIVGGYDSDSLA
jgi:glycosyltransferase involved in cell wall biosynthesis